MQDSSDLVGYCLCVNARCLHEIQLCGLDFELAVSIFLLTFMCVHHLELHKIKLEIGILTETIPIQTAWETHVHPFAEQTELRSIREIWGNSQASFG